MRVAWAADSTDELVWTESSYVRGSYFLDRPAPDGWVLHATLRSSPGDRPNRYTPRLRAARDVYDELIAGQQVAAAELGR